MVWLFALGIIWLAVVHDGFRKVALWTLGITASLFALTCILTIAHG